MTYLTLDDQFETMPWDRIDAVVFDVGDVLVDMNAPEILTHAFPDEPERVRRALEKSTRSPYWHLFDYGEMTDEECARIMAGKETDLYEPIFYLLHHWPDFRFVVEEGEEAVRVCKAHQKKLYVLSNYPEPHFMRNVREYDFFSLFDGYVVSAMEHMLKPDREIYNRLIDRYHLNRQRTVFIDDNPANIAAALLLGWQGICYRRPGQLRQFLGE